MEPTATLRQRSSATSVGKLVSNDPTESDSDPSASEYDSDEDAEDSSGCCPTDRCPWLIWVTLKLAYAGLGAFFLVSMLEMTRWLMLQQDGKGYFVEWPWSLLCADIPWPTEGEPDSGEERLEAVRLLEAHSKRRCGCGGMVHSSLEFFAGPLGSISTRIRDGVESPSSGKPVIELPMRCVMSDRSALESPSLGPLLEEGLLDGFLSIEGEEYLDAAGWVLVLHVAIELLLGANSSFWPYLRSLPKQPDIPLLWDEQSLRLLAGTGLDVYNEESLRPTLRRMHAQLLSDGSPLTGFGLTLDLFVTAYALVRSRHFYASGRAMMLPLIDFVNHQLDSAAPWMDVKWEFHESAVHLYLPQSIELAGNTELGYDYWHGGEKLANINLQLYGFVYDTMTPVLSLDVRDLLPKPNASEWFMDEYAALAFVDEYADLASKSLFWLKAGVWPDGNEPSVDLEDAGEVLPLLCFLRLHALEASGRRPSSIREHGRPACSAPSAEWCKQEPELEAAVLRYFSELLQASQKKLVSADAELQQTAGSAESSKMARVEAAQMLNSMVSSLNARVTSGIQAAVKAC